MTFIFKLTKNGQKTTKPLKIVNFRQILAFFTSRHKIWAKRTIFNHILYEKYTRNRPLKSQEHTYIISMIALRSTFIKELMNE